MSGRRWAVAIIVVFALVVLVAFARGRDHRRGQQVGAIGPVPAASVVRTVTA